MCECVSVRGDVFGQNENSSTRLFHTQTLVGVITDCIIGIKSVRCKLNEKEAKVDSVARLPVTFGAGRVWWEMVTFFVNAGNTNITRCSINHRADDYCIV